jgi:hypothetical protein
LAAKQTGNFNDYCGLRSAIMRSLMPGPVVIPLMRFALDGVKGNLKVGAR